MTGPNSIPGPGEPKLVNAYGSTGAGKWYAGALPPGSGGSVLVFVPGLGQNGPSFWGEDDFYGKNQLYRSAFLAGYRTAFVSFHPPGHKPMDMWQNGRILAWQVEEIRKYFGVPRVTLVCHSKGGVDAETAAAYYGAGDGIDRIVTLSSPHWGSQLADIAYSSAGWALAEHLGAHSDGCYVMQTGYMKEFRELTEHQPPFGRIRTFAGSGRGPAFTPLWGGSLLMDRFGPNDGVVTVQSARHPAGGHLATLSLNHAQMRFGRYIWPYLSAALEDRPLAVAAVAGPAASPARGELIRGGRLEKGVRESLTVDSAVLSLSITVTCTSALSLRLSAPDKTVHTDFSLQKFKDGTRIYQLTADAPARGVWTLSAPPGKGAYLCCAYFYGTAGARPPAGVRSKTRIFKTWPDRYELVEAYELAPASPERLPHLEDGLYNLETTLSGELADGSAYARTLIRSMLVKPKSADPKAFLAGLRGRRVRGV